MKRKENNVKIQMAGGKSKRKNQKETLIFSMQLKTEW